LKKKPNVLHPKKFSKERRRELIKKSPYGGLKAKRGKSRVTDRETPKSLNKKRKTQKTKSTIFSKWSREKKKKE